MVDLEILKAKGVSVETLKEPFKLKKGKKGEDDLWEIEPGKKGKVKRLIRTIKGRISDGRNFNISNYRLYQALDEAWDSPLKQITPTMLMSLIDISHNTEAVESKLQSWGINPS